MEVQLLGDGEEVAEVAELHGAANPTPAGVTDARESAERSMTEQTAPATQLTPAHADAIEIFAEVLAQSEEEGLADDFYSRLCEGITRCTALRRVVIFRYDSTR